MKKRPHIPSIQPTASSAAEAFQNKTLRPIIKMQHSLLIAFLKNYLKGRKVNVEELSDHRKTEKIENSLQQDSAFRNELKGLIIGHFTVAEYQEYLTAQKELNKRLFTIVQQRWCDSLEEL